MYMQSNFRVDYGKADYSNLVFDAADCQVLKDLAKKVQEIAALPMMQERKQLWTKHNDLEMTRPLILADPEHGWNEIITPDQILCKNNIAQYWEYYLRKLIHWGTVLDDDFVVEAIFDLPHVYSETPWGIEGSELQVTNKSYIEGGGAYHIDKILTDYELIDRIRKPKLSIDYEKSTFLLEVAEDIFSNILNVRQHSVWYWSLGLTDEYVFLRGMEDLMFDFYDEPEKVHEVMEILMNALLEKVDYLEQEKLFHLNNDWTYVGSGGIGYTNQLPQADFSGHVRTKDLWLLLESQITVGVSPEMFAEFIWPYQKQIAERFGLLCYGCCEPLDERIDIIKEAKNLRRVSVSPWANQEWMSEKLARDYVYSLKLSPTPLASSNMDENTVRSQLRESLKTCRNNQLELIMKDNHTLGHNPNNLTRWTQIAREEVENL